MAVTPVTPIPGVNNFVANGGVSVIAINPMPNGGVITNPYTAGDQNLSSAEPLYVNPVQSSDIQGNNSTFALQPGQSWTVIPGQTTPTYVNAASAGHRFSVVSW